MAFMGAYPWIRDQQDNTATIPADEVLCEGSDSEESPLAKAERQRRREAIGARYLQGHSPFIQSAQLTGPFERKSGWVNPWRSKQPARKGFPKRNAVAQIQSLRGDPIPATLGKHKRSGSDASMRNVGKRLGIQSKDHRSRDIVKSSAAILTECPITSIDIVGNRQSLRPSLYDGIKQFVPSGLGNAMDSPKKSERDNCVQLNTAAKRRADTSWLKGADIVKRSRKDLPELVSPTPKVRPRDIFRGDQNLFSSPKVFNKDSETYEKRLLTLNKVTAPALQEVGRPLKQDLLPSLNNGAVQIKHHASIGDLHKRQPSRSANRGLNARNPFMDSNGPMTNQKSPSQPSHEIELDTTVEVGRGAPRPLSIGGSFDESFSKLGRKVLLSQVSSQTPEPSPVQTILRNELDQQTLYGLSQASELALAAEITAPPTPGSREPSAEVVEQRLLGFKDDDFQSLSKEKILSCKAVRSASNSPAGQSKGLSSRPNVAEVTTELHKKRHVLMLKGHDIESPLPPGSFKYQRIRRQLAYNSSDHQNGLNDLQTDDAKKPMSRQPQPQVLESNENQALVSMIVSKNDEAEAQEEGENLSQAQLAEPLTQEWPNDLSGNEESGDDAVDEESCVHSADINIVVVTAVPALRLEAPSMVTGTQPKEPQNTPNEESERSEPSPAEEVVPHHGTTLLDQEVEKAKAETGLITSVTPAEQEQVGCSCEVSAEAVDEDVADAALPRDQGMSTTFEIVADLPQIPLTEGAFNVLVNSSEAKELDTSVDEAANDDHTSAGSNCDKEGKDETEPFGVVSASRECTDSNLSGNEDDAATASPALSSIRQRVAVANIEPEPVVEEDESQPAPQSPWVTEGTSALKPVKVVVTSTLSESKRQFSMSQSKDAAALLLDISLDHNPTSPTSENAPSQHHSQVSRPTTPDKPAMTLAPNAMTPSPKQLSQRTSPLGHFASTQDLVSMSLANPWIHNRQSPVKAQQPTKSKKRVSFSQLPCHGDDDDEEEIPEPPRRAAESRSGSREVSSPAPPAGAEALTERDDDFHRSLKGTRDMPIPRDEEEPASYASVDAMAEAFLAAETVPSGRTTSSGSTRSAEADEAVRSAIAASCSSDNVENGESGGPRVVPPSVAVLMTESPTANPWAGEGEDVLRPPFTFATAGQTMSDEEEMVDDVLDELSDMLDEWDVDTELDKARKANGGMRVEETTARERMGGMLRY